jgi:class 3 adenylate cyclase
MGMMAYFGRPEAHDNNADRAVNSGWSIVEAVSRLIQHATLPKLSARVGIDSGPVGRCSRNPHWFTEGFDTADLKEAKALLDELTVN